MVSDNKNDKPAHIDQLDHMEARDMLTIPSTRGATRCAAEGCDGSPWHKGWHHVTGRHPHAERWPIVASLFVCSEHLAEAEQAMTEHMRQARTLWTVETFRMYGWDDDGRGAAYRVTRGEGTDHTEQLPLF